MCLSEDKASHAHKMGLSLPPQSHFLEVVLLLSPTGLRCLLRELCPVRIPITTLDCVVLKDNNRALVAKLWPEINSRACLCALQGPIKRDKEGAAVDC